MIEILQFGLSENRGGIETYLNKIWTNIDHSRFHFSFIDMTGEGKTPCFYEELKKSGATFYKITPRKVSILKNKHDIEELFQNNHFDILHFNVNTLSYVFPIQVALKNDVKVIVHSRNGGSASSKHVTKILHSVNKKRISKYPIVRIAVSQKAGEWLFGPSKFSVYYNGVETSKYKFLPNAREKLRKQMNCEDSLVIGNVGAFLPAKNHVFMINVFEELIKSIPNATLLFVGDGPEKSKMEELVREKELSNKVIFLGVRKDLQELYSAMDLFWFPSLYEGFGNVVLEAECSGLPCLLSDCIPLDAMIVDNAVSFGLDKPLSEWAKKIKDVSTMQKLNRSMCYEDIDELGFSVGNEIKRIQELYSRTIG